MIAEDAGSLYERLGGELTIMAAVDLFYDKVLADPVTRPFFDGIDMVVQSRKQVAFMTYAFGGPVAQRGRDLREAHGQLVRDRGLGDAHFDAVADHLRATLVELAIEPALQAEVMSIVAGTRAEVLNR
jgi:hemoglobin